jgi:HD domain
MHRSVRREEAMLTSEITGDLPQIIENKESLYEGDLLAYFKLLFYASHNLANPYHNFRHTLHVIWLCHMACRHYRGTLSRRQMRNLLIAALFHDFDHPGHAHPGEPDPDRLNIDIAIAGLRRHVTAEDRTFLPEIEALIEATHYPYKTSGDELGLLGKILRDADSAQVLNPVWLQQVIIGLAAERGVQPIEVLREQPSFLGTLAFQTKWAQQLFPPELVAAKIAEAEALARLLDAKPASVADSG